MTHPSIPDDDTVRAALRQVVDPEVGMNIVDLGLVYRIAAAADALRQRIEGGLGYDVTIPELGDCVHVR